MSPLLGQMAVRTTAFSRAPGPADPAHDLDCRGGT
jgi:hypothetical protein